ISKFPGGGYPLTPLQMRGLRHQSPQKLDPPLNKSQLKITNISATLFLTCFIQDVNINLRVRSATTDSDKIYSQETLELLSMNNIAFRSYNMHGDSYVDRNRPQQMTTQEGYDRHDTCQEEIMNTICLLIRFFLRNAAHISRRKDVKFDSALTRMRKNKQQHSIPCTFEIFLHTISKNRRRWLSAILNWSRRRIQKKWSKRSYR
ncbi:Hypothetical predicted protein, partial [Paramuricea clavata]